MTSLFNNLRKPHYDAEKDELEKRLTFTLTKAISQEECAAKEKHIRLILVTMWKNGNTNLFWTVSCKMHLKDNPIVSWKFCHVVHKVLSDGPQNALAESLKYVYLISDLGKHWSNLKDGYGKPVVEFCNLIVYKLNFHKKYPTIDANLQISENIFTAISENATDKFLELTNDIHEYLDALMKLQDAVFNFLDWSRSNSVTLRGQCLLMPLLLVIQASDILYNCLVRLYYHLHSEVAAESLQERRSRFQQLFFRMSAFFDKSRNLQLFKTLIIVPELTNQNFLDTSSRVIVAEFSSSSSSCVNQEEEDKMAINGNALLEAQLLDLNEASTSFNVKRKETMSDARDKVIDQLQMEIFTLKERINKLDLDQEQRCNETAHKIQCLEKVVKDLTDSKSQLTRQFEQVSLSKLSPEMLSTLEEKNGKWKQVYSKLRDEHISLLRKHALVNKSLAAEKAAVRETDPSLVCTSPKLEEIERTLDDTQQHVDALEQKKFALSEENRLLEERLHEVEYEGSMRKEKLTQRSFEASQLITQAALLESYKRDLSELKNQLLITVCTNGINSIQNTLNLFHGSELLGCVSSPDFLLSRTRKLVLDVDKLEDLCNFFLDDDSVIDELACCISQFSSRLCETVLQGKTTSQNSSNGSLSDELVSRCLLVVDEALALLTVLQTASWEPQTLIGHCASLFNHLEMVEHYATRIQQDLRGGIVPSAQQSVDNEIETATASIKTAELQFRELLNCARAESSGMQLEVNESILESCCELMTAIKVLIQKSKSLQSEICELRGITEVNINAYYVKNNQWSDGLLSASKAVGCGATALVDSANNLVHHNGKLEHLMACNSQIAVYTSQLLLASKVGARQNSLHLAAVISAGQRVSDTRDEVVAAARRGIKRRQEAGILNLTNVSRIQIQRMFVESRQNVCALESELEAARRVLEQINKQEYAFAEKCLTSDIAFFTNGK